MYVSAALTFSLKVCLLPWLLHRMIRRFGVYWDTDTLLNIPGTMLIGLVVVCDVAPVGRLVGAPEFDERARNCWP